MRNEVRLDATLVSVPKVEETTSGGKKISFLVVVKGMYDHVPLTVHLFSSVALQLEEWVPEWKVGDILDIEGSLDYFQGEVVVVGRYVSNVICRLAVERKRYQELEREAREAGIEEIPMEGGE